ncbi:uncharacterized protein ACJ7VT_011377 [Polymixia lowei]
MTCTDHLESTTSKRPEQDRSVMSDSDKSGMKPPDHLDGKKYFSMQTSPTTATPRAYSSGELDPAMRMLLRWKGLSKEDLKNDRHTSEVIHRIIDNLKELEVIHTEKNSIGSGFHTLPRAAGLSKPLSLVKGPLPPVPSTSQHCSKGMNSLKPLPPWIPPPPSMAAPPAPERIKKSMSCKPVGSPLAAEFDYTLTALRDAFRKKQNLQHHAETKGGQIEQETNVVQL